MKMAPLTVLFGANSSGKSSIGQFLMLLKQTTESADHKAAFNLGDKNSAVEFGSYEEMIYAHNLDLEFEYEWNCKEPLVFQDPHSKQRYRYDAMRFAAEIKMDADAKRPPFVKHFCYHMHNSDAQPMKISLASVEGSRSKYKIDAEGYKFLRIHGRTWPVNAPVHFYAFPDRVFARYQNAGFLADLNLQHQNLFASMSYLGPLREKARRVYSWSGSEPESVWHSGEHTIPAMLAARKRLLNFRPGKRRKTFEEIIVTELKQMGLVENLRVKPLSTERQREYEVKVATKYSSGRGSLPGDSLPDVGVGVAQVLPVLVQCFYAPPGSIIIMEQPEIHLHPSAQSALADVMIDAIHSGENHAARGIQLIIETHSEHFLRRLQRRIAEGVIQREHVEAYFVEPGDACANLKRLDFDVCGYIGNWPENFFGDEMEDVFALAKAKQRRAQTPD